MLRSSKSASNPHFKRMIESLIKSSSNYDRYENRSAYREHLVVPVLVDFRDGQFEVPGMTRNVSSAGVGLLLPAECKEGDQAIITMEQADGGGKHKVLSECRWRKPYGESWFLSGWQFIKVVR